jgi:hypothetical protein
MHIKRYSFCAFVLLALFLVISCSRIIFKYGGKNYETADLAIESQKAAMESVLKNIPKTSSPVGGSVSIILPSASYIQNNFVTLRGKISSEDLKRQMEEYITTILYNGYKATGESVERRGIFDTIFYLQSENPEKTPFKEDYAILLIKNMEGKGQWFMKRRKDNPTILIEIENSNTALPPLQRTMIWLDKIEKIAKEE